jgi:two-component system OmpR family sensor kinase
MPQTRQSGWESISLRTKLTAMSVSLIGLLLLVSSAGTMALVRTYLHQTQDSALISTVEAMRQESPLTVETSLATGALRLPNLPSRYYIAYLKDTGAIMLGLASATDADGALPNLTNFDLRSVIATRGLPFEVDAQGRFVSENSGAGWRMVAAPATTYEGSVVVALPTDNNNALINQYRNIGIGFGLLLLTFSALAIWLTITRALKPLQEVERTAAAVAAGDTSKRLVRLEGATEMARVNNSLNTMLDSIDEALDARESTLDQMRRFVADASHELRTPLVSVRGYAELYRMGALAEKSKLDDAMGRIESEAIRMSSLVENLLSLARIDEASTVEKSKTDIVALCRDAAKDVSVTEHGSEISITDLKSKELKTATKLVASVDANAMRQILINLLANACRFSPKGKNVEVAIGIEAENLVVEVRDRGEGVPKELREKIFERFYRADNSRNRDTGGSGLGLAIVKALVERQGGQISVSETAGGGATFRVSLPRD